MAFEIPEACTLPSAERPVRLAEFDELLTTSVYRWRRSSSTSLTLHLRGRDDLEAVTRDLTAREASCCSFFDFQVTVDGDGLRLDVGVPAEHAAILDSLQAKADASA